ncbi:MAG: Lead, cadmium, zinc and mercury transporting ATPase, partial [Labilithrix sp.]|nr:Lead, cadmium, zinc and mercury transporting ATPase [Labilithrix sp.]
MNLGTAEVVVQRSGRSRLRVRGCVAPELSRNMVDWFEHRPEVSLVCAHPDSATIDVRYNDRAPPGELLRAARDHAFALTRRQRARPARRRRVAIAHAIPGRTRLAVPDATATDLARLSSWLVDQHGVLAAEPGLGSIVVRSEVGQHDPRTLAGAIASSDPSEWPPAPPLDDGSPWLAIAYDSALLVATRRAVAPRPLVAVAVAISAIPTARRTLNALEKRRIGVDLLDLIAIGVSVAVGTPGTAALITWLLAIGDYILHLTKRKARCALAGAIKLDVPTAWRLRADGQTERVATKKLRVGDRVLCDLGVRLPADGVIAKGAATIDTKALTGESMPRTCRQGDAVMASSVVVDGSIVVEIRRTGRDTAAGRIVQILQSAEERPTTLQREAERVADRVVVPTLALAGASALLSSEIDRMTSILITDFGTGIRISVPTSALAAMTLATRGGVLVKGGQFLERLARTDAIVFDKTGTLTSGTPEVVDVVAMNGTDPRPAIALAAAIETRQ